MAYETPGRVFKINEGDEMIGRPDNMLSTRRLLPNGELKVKLSLYGKITLREAVEEKRAYYQANGVAGFVCILTEEFEHWDQIEKIYRELIAFRKNGKCEAVGYEQLRCRRGALASKIVMSRSIKSMLNLDVASLEKFRRDFHGCEYSPFIEKFIEIRQEFFGLSTIDEAMCSSANNMQEFIFRVNLYLQRLRQELSEPILLKKENNWLVAVKRNIRSARRFVMSIANNHNLSVIQLELGYRQTNQTGSLNLQGKLTPTCLSQKVVRRDRDIWLRRIQARYMESWVGCIWRIAYSPSQGYQVHAHVFLLASSKIDDVVEGVNIGQLWVDEINRGQGTYLCYNQFKDRVPENGIGYLSKNSEMKKITLARAIGRRLTLDSALRPEFIRGGRNFGRSLVKNLGVIEKTSSLERYMAKTPQMQLRALLTTAEPKGRKMQRDLDRQRNFVVKTIHTENYVPKDKFKDPFS